MPTWVKDFLIVTEGPYCHGRICQTWSLHLGQYLGSVTVLWQPVLVYCWESGHLRVQASAKLGPELHKLSKVSRKMVCALCRSISCWINIGSMFEAIAMMFDQHYCNLTCLMGYNLHLRLNCTLSNHLPCRINLPWACYTVWHSRPRHPTLHHQLSTTAIRQDTAGSPTEESMCSCIAA